MAAARGSARLPELVFTIDKSMTEILGELFLLVTRGPTRRIARAGLTVHEERWGLLFSYGTTRYTLWTVRLRFEQAGSELHGVVTADRLRSLFGRAAMIALLDDIWQTVLGTDEDARIIAP